MIRALNCQSSYETYGRGILSQVVFPVPFAPGNTRRVEAEEAPPAPTRGSLLADYGMLSPTLQSCRVLSTMSSYSAALLDWSIREFTRRHVCRELAVVQSRHSRG